MIKLTKEKIERLAKDSKGDHWEYVIQLYFLIPGFRECTATEGRPMMSRKTSLFVLDTFQQMYPKNDPWLLNGLWLQKGISSDEPTGNTPEWIIDISNFKLIKKKVLCGSNVNQ